MANSSVNLIDLDFEALKSSLKTHLRSQDRFQDYDFDGSNMNVLLDLMAYNTYLNSFYLNMVASEMFLDSAQLRDSVVSHAKDLNYLPRSFRSAYANIDINIYTSNTVTSVVVPSKTNFTGRVGSNTFNFTTDEAITINNSQNVPGSNNTLRLFALQNQKIYEGSYVTDTFVKNSEVVNQRFILTNPTVDTSSLEMVVIENSGANTYVYNQAYSLFGYGSNSQIFFVQASENEQYEIVFGDGITGRIPKNGAVVSATYRASSGELPNGCDNFINNSAIDGQANVSINVNSSAIGGAVSESINSIKFNAPRSFQTQERAITESDFKNLMTREFPEIEAISVYGGEKTDPPQYGKVFISVDVLNADKIPELNKQRYAAYLADKIALSTSVEFIEPSYIDLLIDSTVKYNYNSTPLTEQQIRSKVLQKMISYANTYLNDYNVELNYSNFVADVDSADQSIISNDTSIRPYISLRPTLGESTNYSFSFDAPVLITTPTVTSHPITTDRGVYSTSFIFGGITCQLEDDGIGNIRIVRLTATDHVEVKKVGTINYNNGSVIISDFNVSAYTGNEIKFIVQTTTQDIATQLKNILRLKEADITVNLNPVRR
jgi:hypothetical protein